MAKIFSGAARIGSARVVDPVARTLLRIGISPDAVTVLGTAGVLVGALGFGARGELVVGVLIVVAFALTDAVDGAMARARGHGTPAASGAEERGAAVWRTSQGTRFGALLDSTMDRIADGAVFGAVVYWYATKGEAPTVAAAMVCVVASQVISYVKARAQSVGIACDVGLMERVERLVLVGIGALATGFGVGWALPAALWLLAALSLVTVGQRVLHVRREDRKGAGR